MWDFFTCKIIKFSRRTNCLYNQSVQQNSFKKSSSTTTIRKIGIATKEALHNRGYFEVRYQTAKVLLCSRLDTMPFKIWDGFQMKFYAPLWLKGLQKCQRSKLTVKIKGWKYGDHTTNIFSRTSNFDLFPFSHSISFENPRIFWMMYYLVKIARALFRFVIYTLSTYSYLFSTNSVIMPLFSNRSCIYVLILVYKYFLLRVKILAM